WRRAGRSSSPTPRVRSGCRGGPCAGCSLVALPVLIGCGVCGAAAGALEARGLGVLGALEVELRVGLVVPLAVGLVVEPRVGVALDVVALGGAAALERCLRALGQPSRGVGLVVGLDLVDLLGLLRLR